MPVQPIRGLGHTGVVIDTAAVLLEPNAFSDVRNVRFDNGSVSKILGHTQILSSLNNISPGGSAVQPHFGIHWPRPDTRYNIYATESAVYRMNQAGDISNISNGPYSAGGRWQGSLVSGGYGVVMNNTVNIPQYSLFDGAGGVASNTLQNLPGWNYEQDVTNLSARVVRPLQNVLFAGNLRRTVGGVVLSQPGTIRISNRAAPGAIPQVWDPNSDLADTNDAFELSQTEEILEMEPLRGTMVVYTGDSYHLVTPTPIQGRETDVRNFFGYGILAGDCVAEFDGQHFVVDRNDIYVHSGTGTPQSVADSRTRDYFFANLNGTHYENTFVSLNRRHDEIWVCFPNLSANADGDCNEALIWNYRHNTWTIRDLPNIRGGFQGPMVRGGQFIISDERLVTVGRADSLFYAMDEGNTFNGTNFTAFVERKRGAAKADENSKWVGSFYPLFDANYTTTTAVTISLRGQNNFANDVDLTDNRTDVRTFNPQEDYKIDPRTNGRLINFRIETTDDQAWTLAGVSMMIEIDDGR